MTITEFKHKLRLHYDDTETTGYLLSEEQLDFIVKRSIGKVNATLNSGYELAGDGFSPDFTDDAEELLTLQSLVFVCETMRAKVARNFAFKSGDKAVDKTKQPSFWADLHKDYLKKLHGLIKRLAPHLDDESSLLAPGAFPTPEVYEVNSQ